MTYAFTSVLAQMQEGYTFEELFDRVKLKMKVFAPRQNPQWEGPSNVVIFGDALSERETFYKVESKMGPTSYRVDVGTLEGVFPGSIIEILNESRDSVLTEARVGISFLTHAFIEVAESYPLDMDAVNWVRVKEKSYPSIAVNIKSLLPQEEWELVQEDIKALPLSQFVEENADLFLSENESGLLLSTKEGLEVGQLSRGGTRSGFGSSFTSLCPGQIFKVL